MSSVWKKMRETVNSHLVLGLVTVAFVNALSEFISLRN